MAYRKTALLFDLDGTLWDSSENVAKAWRLAAADLGVNLQKSAADIQGYMGWPMDEIRDDLFSGISDTGIRQQYMDACSKRENEVLEVFGGVLFENEREVLEMLKENCFMAVVSNCQAGYIDAFLKAHRFENLFDDFACWEDTKKEKAFNIRMVMERNGLDPGLDRIVYIGDTVKDYEAASKAGIEFVWAQYGFGNNVSENKIEKLADLLLLVEKNS